MSALFAQPSIPAPSRPLDSPSTPNPPPTRPITKTYKAYFPQDEIELAISAAERPVVHEQCREDKAVGFPRRVIATGQALYHRFHLYFKLSDFNYIEVSLSTLYVAAKLHDCLKKPRDLILACYAIRQPEMLKGRLMLSVDPAAFDPKQLESERKRMLSVERLVLETLCFNFMVGAEGGGSPGLDAFGLVIKLGRKAGFRKKFIYTSWKMIIDSYRTTASLSYTPQAICISCFYATALLHSPPPNTLAPAETEGTELQAADAEMTQDMAACRKDVYDWQRRSRDTWLKDLSVSFDDVHDTVHLLLDLHGFLLQSASRPTTTTTELSLTPSFGTPVSPSDTPLGPSQPTRVTNTTLNMHPQMMPALPLPPRYNWTQEKLMQLKIWLREQYPKDDAEPSGDVKQLNIETLTSGFGRNDETIRFLFW
ncbi:hypothetical protein QFC20_006816 [Naganishia adeliensis]|uniref:Uncharacterized protein n=1 Tax=Naganishia adeliensis TaxID=92952 RepID=A0ACC2V661_9TREE|nr:hypothetical protein QFC20_006816 [Naganishia adeliensis]